MSAHLSRHVLERLVVDDPREPVPPTARVHVASCDHCAVRIRAIETARNEYLAARPAERFAAAVSARARSTTPVERRTSVWQRARWPAALLAAACAGGLILVFARPAAVVPAADAIRFKGQAAVLQAYVRRGEQTQLLHAGDALYAGDQLAFKYTLSQPQHCLLLGIDDAGTITHYFPDAALAPAALLPAGTRALPVGVELDAHKGRERLVAFFSASELDEPRVRDALTRALAAARAHGAGVDQLEALDVPAHQVSVWFQKP